MHGKQRKLPEDSAFDLDIFRQKLRNIYNNNVVIMCDRKFEYTNV